MASSSGAKPAKKMNPLAVVVMEDVGIDISPQKPKSLTQNMISKAAKIITMGCLDVDACPIFLVKDRDKLEGWGIEDPAGKPVKKFREVREEIRWRVEGLIKEIS